LTGLVATLVTALVTKIQQEAHSDFTPEIAPFTYSGHTMRKNESAAMLKSRDVCRGASANDSTKAKVLDAGGRTMSPNHDGAGQPQMMGIEYLDGLYSYAMVLTRNHAEAEDLVQETYTRAMQAMQKLRVDSNIKGWLFTILKNIWFNQLRKRRNGPQMVDIEAGDSVANNIVEPSTNSYDLYVSKLEAEQVRAAIQKLPVEFREIILLREYEDLSYREIANILQCPLGTVMSRLGRARARLRTLLTAQQR
jgi:RNA polymerase sigma-70 factor, ECF subfamily